MVRDHEAVNQQALALVKKLNVTPEDNDTSRALSSLVRWLSLMALTSALLSVTFWQEMVPLGIPIVVVCALLLILKK